MMLCTECPRSAGCNGFYCPENEADLPQRADKPPAPPVSVAMIVARVEKSSQSMTCLTFATVVEAERFLTDRFGAHDCNGRWHPDDADDMRTFADDFFLEYWDECGGIASFTIYTAQHGKPFIAF
jgi:hypothetical protein